MLFHVFSRAIEGKVFFETPADYTSFEFLLNEALAEASLRVFDYVLMPNHWHFLCSPDRATDVTDFVKWVKQTHAARTRAWTGTTGRGSVYQSRFGCTPVQDGDAFLRVAKYIDRNPVRKGLVARPERWLWGGLARRLGVSRHSADALAPWPVDPPEDWSAFIDQPLRPEQLAAIRTSVQHELPFGDPTWVERSAHRLGLGSRLRAVLGRQA